MSNLIDMQDFQENRKLSIHKVGIKDLKYPLIIANKNFEKQNSIGKYTISITLSKNKKGVHMSRFIEVLESISNIPVSIGNLKKIMQKFCDKLESHSSQLQIEFVYFKIKKSPKSFFKSKLAYNTKIKCSYHTPSRINREIEIQIPVKTLCPSSKAISKYGAHNQRSYITVNAEILSKKICFDDIINLVENHASSQIFSLLKREDEKYITEIAYENPKFVEDIVRDISLSIKKCSGIGYFSVECENIESIHNHSAFAYIEDKGK